MQRGGDPGRVGEAVTRPESASDDSDALRRSLARARAAERDALAQRDLALERLQAAELEARRTVEVQEELDRVLTELATLRGSISWRLTAPLRLARRVAKR
jgi:hypothetical protein